MIDKELFDLCKEVYERFPSWGLHIVDGNIASYRSDLRFYKNSGLQGYEPTISNEPVYDVRYINPIPLYTSDYLLEKLPPNIRPDSDIFSYWLELSPMGKEESWSASYELNTEDESLYFVFADTPLKALLKLVLALNKAGVEL